MRKNKKAVAFLQVSNASQNEKKQTLQYQRNIVQQLAHKKLTIEKTFECIGSAKDVKRALTDVEGYCRQHPDIKVLLIASCDRISQDFETFIDTFLSFKAMGVQIQASAHTTEDLAD